MHITNQHQTYVNHFQHDLTHAEEYLLVNVVVAASTHTTDQVTSCRNITEPQSPTGPWRTALIQSNRQES